MSYTRNNPSISYNREYDILYCAFSDKSNSYGDEEPDNIVIMRDIDTEEITGVTILDFIKMYKNFDKRLEYVSQYINTAKIAAGIINSMD